MKEQLIQILFFLITIVSSCNIESESNPNSSSAYVNVKDSQEEYKEPIIEPKIETSIETGITGETFYIYSLAREADEFGDVSLSISWRFFVDRIRFHKNDAIIVGDKNYRMKLKIQGNFIYLTDLDGWDIENKNKTKCYKASKEQYGIKLMSTSALKSGIVGYILSKDENLKAQKLKITDD